MDCMSLRCMKWISKVHKVTKSAYDSVALVFDTTSLRLQDFLHAFPHTISTIHTNDLRFTEGKSAPLPKERDLLVYVIDSHDPNDILTSRLAMYSKHSSVLLLGDKKTLKSVTTQFDVSQRKYGSDLAVMLIEKQEIKVQQPTEHEFDVQIDSYQLHMKAVQGLFSYKGIDTATDFLLRNLPYQSLSGTIIDLGCGYGMIGTHVAKKLPNSSIHMIDSNASAVKYARKNITNNECSNAKVTQGYFLSKIRSGYANHIIANPPTHTRSEEVTRLFRQMNSVLQTGGTAFLVINKAVKYARYANEIFSEVSIFKQEGKFKIIFLRKG